jgi:hypothetical protein
MFEKDTDKIILLIKQYAQFDDTWLSSPETFYDALQTFDHQFRSDVSNLIYPYTKVTLQKKCAVRHYENGYSTFVANDLNWENIYDESVKFSHFFKGLMLAVGGKENSLFEMYVFNEGELLSSHIVGQYAQNYFEFPQTGNVHIFSNSLRVEYEALSDIFNKTDYSRQPDALSELLGVELVQRFDWVEEDKELSKLFEFI